MHGWAPVEIQITLQDDHHLVNYNGIHEKLQASVCSDKTRIRIPADRDAPYHPCIANLTRLTETQALPRYRYNTSPPPYSTFSYTAISCTCGSVTVVARVTAGNREGVSL